MAQQPGEPEEYDYDSEERGIPGYITSNERDDSSYTPEEKERYQAFVTAGLAVYESGMSRLAELAPDLQQLLLACEPVALVPYRDFALAAAGKGEDEDGQHFPCIFLNVETFSTMSTDEAAFTLGHEAIHLRDEHHALERLEEQARKRRGYAQDVAINDELIARGLPRPQLPTMPCSELLGIEPGLSWAEIEPLLPAEAATDPGYYLRRLYPDEFPYEAKTKPL